MSLLDSLQKDMVSAMKAKDKARLATVRMLKAAVTNEQINVGHDLTPDEEVSVLSRELKQRKDSLEEFKAAGRDEAVQKLEEEIKVVEGYMPKKQLSADEVKTVVEETIEQVGATSKADFGKVMGAVMPKLKGKADGKLVNSTVMSLLNK
ncbi:GatB/YqeY domain-containing protein [Ligilactobacillus apodemi]|uniref:GatB Yqey domain-containing protein n=1 Tax=Ligilactobacillus apodemi DSM 16634 = JCM 16172 TaxID=1423724 RepID=A0A0R1U0A3_9LACO|nr:GatB/YqeY domain-containing protein [Ligilactobacillus apodemi]KRL84568.1 GatB Yqey domain-containing protein [Ligilactobacillus apodemi DSM 16634 = JCM 16172]